MEFEWNESKNLRNVEKHGIGFEQASRIFEGITLDWIDDRVDYAEERIISLGMIDGILIVVVVP